MGLALFQGRDVGHERCDANAPGDQDVQAGGRVRGEQIGRRRDLQPVADPDLAMQVVRAAAGDVLQAYGNAVELAVRRVAGQ
ncbi:hypothetical protein D3C87_1899390 [compost metagenome]